MSTIPINLSGTLAADPQSKTLASGRACASFRLAVNHWRLDKATGEYVNDSTSWFGVDCYGPLASNCSMSLQRGMSVVVQGNLKIREWSTDEKAGLAPTVVAEHIGPDLRYGTANYQKASGNNRQPVGQQAGKEQTANGNDSPWGNLGGDGSGDSADSGGDGDDGRGDGGDSRGEGEDTGSGSATETDDYQEDESTGAHGDESGNADDAIVRDTVAAAAPF